MTFRIAIVGIVLTGVALAAVSVISLFPSLQKANDRLGFATRPETSVM